jgi:hypothetical protein
MKLDRFGRLTERSHPHRTPIEQGRGSTHPQTPPSKWWQGSTEWSHPHHGTVEEGVQEQFHTKNFGCIQKMWFVFTVTRFMSINSYVYRTQHHPSSSSSQQFLIELSSNQHPPDLLCASPDSIQPGVSKYPTHGII